MLIISCWVVTACLRTTDSSSELFVWDEVVSDAYSFHRSSCWMGFRKGEEGGRLCCAGSIWAVGLPGVETSSLQSHSAA